MKIKQFNLGKHKRLAAAVLSLILVTGSFPGTVEGQVHAAAPDYAAVTQSSTEVSDFTELKSLAENASGELVLTITGDIDMTDTINVPEGSRVTLLSSGNHVLKRTQTYGEMFDVSGTLILGSSGGMGKGNTLTVDGGAQWTGKTDAILGRGTDNSGTGASSSIIYAGSDSEVYLYSGVTLQNNECSSAGKGGAVTLWDDAALYLHGAVLCGNKSQDGGGAVKTYDGSRFEMTAGEVRNNQGGTHGGAFQIYGSGAECTISGGVLKNNLCSRYGGAITVSDGSSLVLTGNVKIMNNRTTSNGAYPGGGIAFADADTQMSITGTVMIFGNTRGDGRNDNLHIGDYACNLVGLDDLGEDSYIGVTLKSKTGVFTQSAAKDYHDKFFSDDTQYGVLCGADNKLSLDSSWVRITRQPEGIDYPQEKTLTVEAQDSQGDSLQYEWYYYQEQQAAVRAQGDAGSSTYTLPDNLKSGDYFYYCIITNAQGGQATTNVVRVSVPHTHEYGEDWCYNAESHWKECACGDKLDVTAHSYGEWITDKEPTETEEGSKHRNCDVCSYRDIETIPKNGSLDKKEELGVNAPETVISTSLQELAEAVLEEDELDAVAGGEDIRIILAVEDAQNTVSDTDKTAVTSSLGSRKLGQYLDISLYKLIHESRSPVTQTKNEISITITIPDNLKNKDTETDRVYSVIRVHNGETSILEDTDGDAGTITIQTDRFSTYAIVYEEDDNTGGGSGSVSGGGVSDDVSGNGSSGTTDDVSGNGSGGTIGDVSGNGSGGTTGDGNGGSGTTNNENGNSGTNGNGNSNGNAASGNNSDRGRDEEPRTGDNTHVQMYATIAMIAGLSYLIMMFAGKHGMTQERKKELVSRLIGWAKQGGKLRRLFALAAIFLLLVYYHSIGRQVTTEWKEVYEK